MLYFLHGSPYTYVCRYSLQILHTSQQKYGAFMIENTIVEILHCAFYPTGIPKYFLYPYVLVSYTIPTYMFS